MKHFSNQDLDISGLLNVTGRDQRYISEDFHENSLTMAIEACKKVIRTTNIDIQNINLVVFVSSTQNIYLLQMLLKFMMLWVYLRIQMHMI